MHARTVVGYVVRTRKVVGYAHKNGSGICGAYKKGSGICGAYKKSSGICGAYTVPKSLRHLKVPVTLFLVVFVCRFRRTIAVMATY